MNGLSSYTKTPTATDLPTTPARIMNGVPSFTKTTTATAWPTTHNNIEGCLLSEHLYRTPTPGSFNCLVAPIEMVGKYNKLTSSYAGRMWIYVDMNRTRTLYEDRLV